MRNAGKACRESTLVGEIGFRTVQDPLRHAWSRNLAATQRFPRSSPPEIYADLHIAVSNLCESLTDTYNDRGGRRQSGGYHESI